MGLTIAAIQSGTEPVGRLPEASFHRWLEDSLGCPKCDVRYNLVVDYERATGRSFAEDSRGLIRMLTKAIFMGHGDGHKVTHFETQGVIVRSFVPEEQRSLG